ncbi:MAG TPA: PIN domain-containing protein [Cytophagales bacterium]|nr:PIN domain-containing protein [Cytophagales bacterium]
MNKILIDTNIVIDLLARRKPFYEDAARLFSLADKKKITLSVSALTLDQSEFLGGLNY